MRTRFLKPSLSISATDAGTGITRPSTPRRLKPKRRQLPILSHTRRRKRILLNLNSKPHSTNSTLKTRLEADTNSDSESPTLVACAKPTYSESSLITQHEVTLFSTLSTLQPVLPKPIYPSPPPSPPPFIKFPILQVSPACAYTQSLPPTAIAPHSATATARPTQLRPSHTLPASLAPTGTPYENQWHAQSDGSIRLVIRPGFIQRDAERRWREAWKCEERFRVEVDSDSPEDVLATANGNASEDPNLECMERSVRVVPRQKMPGKLVRGDTIIIPDPTPTSTSTATVDTSSESR